MKSGEYIDGLKQKIEAKDRSLVRLAAELEKANARIRELEANAAYPESFLKVSRMHEARIRELEAELTATRLAFVE